MSDTSAKLLYERGKEMVLSGEIAAPTSAEVEAMCERIRMYRPKGSTLWGFTEDAKEVPKCKPDWEYAEFVRVK